MSKNSSKTYEATVRMTAEEFNRINNLLSIEEFGMDPKLDEEYGAVQNEDRLICVVNFEDGVSLELFLRSGIHNYYIDPIFSAKGLGEVGSDEACFELSKDNEFIHQDNTYLLHISIQE